MDSAFDKIQQLKYSQIVNLKGEWAWKRFKTSVEPFLNMEWPFLQQERGTVSPSLRFLLVTWSEEPFGKLWRMVRRRLCMLLTLTTKERCEQARSVIFQLWLLCFGEVFIFDSRRPFLATWMAARWRASVDLPYLSQTPSMQHMCNRGANNETRCSWVSCFCKTQLYFAKSF